MDHHVLHISREHRVPVLVDLASAPGRTVVFTRTKHGAKALARQLNKSGVPTVDLHGNLSQGARTRNMASFHSGKATTLVATDIAARGIHVDDVALVVHADPPTEHKAYLHRSGRTARAGAAGTVITLMTDEQRRDVQSLTRAAGIKPLTTRIDGPAHPMLDDPRPRQARRFPAAWPLAAPARQSGGGNVGGGGGGGGSVGVGRGGLRSASAGGGPAFRPAEGALRGGEAASSSGGGSGGQPRRSAAATAPRRSAPAASRLRCRRRDVLAAGLVHAGLVRRHQARDRQRLEPLDDALDRLGGGAGLLVDRPHHPAEHVVELLGDLVAVLGVDLAGRARRLEREPEVEQAEADRELGDRDLVAVAAGRGDDAERGQGLEVRRRLSWRSTRRSRSARDISTGWSACHGASMVRRSAMSSGVASAGMPATYRSIADSVKPWLCSSCTSSSRATWSGE